MDSRPGAGWQNLAIEDLPHGYTDRYFFYEEWPDGTYAEPQVDVHSYQVGAGHNPPWLSWLRPA